MVFTSRAAERIRAAAHTDRPASVLRLCAAVTPAAAVDRQWLLAVAALARDGFTDRFDQAAAGPGGVLQTDLAEILAGAWLQLDAGRVAALTALADALDGTVEPGEAVAVAAPLLPADLLAGAPLPAAVVLRRVAQRAVTGSWQPPRAVAELTVAHVTRLAVTVAEPAAA